MEKIMKILNEILPDIDFETEHSLVEDGIIDSFDIVSIISELSEEFQINIPVEEIEPCNFNSAQAICTLVERMQENQR